MSPPAAGTTFTKRINQGRVRIDAIDRQLVALLNRRAHVAREISEAKRELRMAHRQPARERQVLNNATSGNGGPLSAAALRRVFGQIIQETRAAASKSPRAAVARQRPVRHSGDHAPTTLRRKPRD